SATSRAARSTPASPRQDQRPPTMPGSRIGSGATRAAAGSSNSQLEKPICNGSPNTPTSTPAGHRSLPKSTASTSTAIATALAQGDQARVPKPTRPEPAGGFPVPPYAAGSRSATEPASTRPAGSRPTPARSTTASVGPSEVRPWPPTSARPAHTTTASKTAVVGNSPARTRPERVDLTTRTHRDPPYPADRPTTSTTTPTRRQPSRRRR